MIRGTRYGHAHHIDVGAFELVARGPSASCSSPALTGSPQTARPSPGPSPVTLRGSRHWIYSSAKKRAWNRFGMWSWIQHTHDRITAFAGTDLPGIPEVPRPHAGPGIGDGVIWPRIWSPTECGQPPPRHLRSGRTSQTIRPVPSRALQAVGPQPGVRERVSC